MFDRDPTCIVSIFASSSGSIQGTIHTHTKTLNVHVVERGRLVVTEPFIDRGNSSWRHHRRKMDVRHQSIWLLIVSGVLTLISIDQRAAKAQHQPNLLESLSHRQLRSDPDKKAQNSRQYFFFLFPGQGSSVTVTSTKIEFFITTVIFTCTVSTTACAGRRRRRAVFSDLFEDQFLSPSPVHK